MILEGFRVSKSEGDASQGFRIDIIIILIYCDSISGSSALRDDQTVAETGFRFVQIPVALKSLNTKIASIKLIVFNLGKLFN